MGAILLNPVEIAVRDAVAALWAAGVPAPHRVTLTARDAAALSEAVGYEPLGGDGIDAPLGTIHGAHVYLPDPLMTQVADAPLPRLTPEQEKIWRRLTR